MKEGIEVHGLDALLAAGRKLLELDPEAFAKVLAAARAFVALHEKSDEDADVFASRLAQIRPRGIRLLD